MNNFYVHAQERVKALMASVFGWMSYALLLTGISAFYVASNERLVLYIHSHTGIAFLLAVIQIGLVIALSALVNRLSFGTALVLFTLYATLTGVTLSSIFLVFTLSSLIGTFFVATGMFAAMALYGVFTKSDLTGMGSFLLMALFGMIIALIVNMFVQSQFFNLFLSMVGVIIFALFTAWDVQRIKNLAQYELPEAASISLALSMYLNFINLFINLLQIMGDRKK